MSKTVRCTVENRQRVRRAARALQETAPTAVVETMPPVRSEHDAWTLDAVLRETDGVPPEVLRELALTGLTLQPTPTQAEHQYLVATA
ncbi:MULTISPECIES: hypothetical protein [Haloarcula]|jgi:hypothetical protein|uniref:Uncharacterized protein n=3 Tax=Haloarcula marismortui TaxID=2238 RepID=Q5V7J0_HALMA|nr:MULTISPECIES: hypothetical protein [Haloarcula]AAV44459.1 unknown [Haloarcula marismortui ATCC 43049]EMA14000.1 hypothetical protein C435_16250 [Haloarcula californiae ATCC 33799]NHN65772.1 hypothetical protein [Haloarcula sp. JP-Z28]NHN66068.1 hypothetical protein [Haloarcula sp. JP-Z28]QCP89677.1 hypothetical protein E6P14_01935 [Haloarcula marismortui ATCC 43049]